MRFARFNLWNLGALERLYPGENPVGDFLAAFADRWPTRLEASKADLEAIDPPRGQRVFGHYPEDHLSALKAWERASGHTSLSSALTDLIRLADLFPDDDAFVAAVSVFICKK